MQTMNNTYKWVYIIEKIDLLNTSLVERLNGWKLCRDTLYDNHNLLSSCLFFTSMNKCNESSERLVSIKCTITHLNRNITIINIIKPMTIMTVTMTLICVFVKSKQLSMWNDEFFIQILIAYLLCKSHAQLDEDEFLLNSSGHRLPMHDEFCNVRVMRMLL